MNAETLSSHKWTSWRGKLGNSSARAHRPGPWPVALPDLDKGERGYVNRESGRMYTPHTEEERAALLDDRPRRVLVKGGEGSGKSVFGIVKVLERLRRGCSGIMGSPDHPHLTKSLWPEFRRWCPWDQVVPQQASRISIIEWEPHGTFTITFRNGAQLMVGGFDNPEAWEGPNVNFAHVDEARRKKDPRILTVLDGRIRIPGPGGIPPQLWLTTTPRKHWLFTYFGGAPGDKASALAEAVDNATPPPPDPFAGFKQDARVLTLRTEDNQANLDPTYFKARQQSLTEVERRVLMDAEWLDTDDAEKFLTSMILWDNLAQPLPPPTRGTPLIMAADAGVSNDSFGLVGVSAHPADRSRVAVRFIREWKPPAGGSLDFDLIEKEIERLCRELRVVHLAYDPYQLHQMMVGLQNRGVVPTKPFNQGAERLIADKGLLDAIMAGTLAHDGNPALRDHINNADRLTNDDRKTLRLIKREPSMKIDLAVALSMALARFMDPKVRGTTGDNVGVPLEALLGGVARNVIAGSTR